MGINLICYTLEQDGTAKEQKWFDTIWHSWDREFSSEPSFDWQYRQLGHAYDGERYQRPQNFSAARAWVGAHVTAEGNAARLYQLLDFLEAHEHAYLYISY